MTSQMDGDSPPAWDMSMTRQLVELQFGADQLATLRPVLRAVTTRLIHARIHFQDYARLVESRLEQPIQQGTPWWELMWTDDGEDVGASNYFFVASEGYVYASVQALHAIADNLAHVAYYVLGWNVGGRLPLRKVSMATVSERLQKDLPTSSDLLPICEAFGKLNAQAHYQALADVTNHVKHHGGLPVTVSWGPEEGVSYQVLLGAFMRNDLRHPEREVSVWLEATYDTMSRAVVEIGCALNDWLRSKT